MSPIGSCRLAPASTSSTWIPKQSWRASCPVTCKDPEKPSSRCDKRNYSLMRFLTSRPALACTWMLYHTGNQIFAGDLETVPQSQSLHRHTGSELFRVVARGGGHGQSLQRAYNSTRFLDSSHQNAACICVPVHCCFTLEQCRPVEVQKLSDLRTQVVDQQALEAVCLPTRHHSTTLLHSLPSQVHPQQALVQ